MVLNGLAAEVVGGAARRDHQIVVGYRPGFLGVHLAALEIDALHLCLAEADIVFSSEDRTRWRGDVAGI